MLQPRLPTPSVNFVDEYCAAYQTLFPQVRSFEAFKHLHLGMISDIKRKSLPVIAKVVGLDNEQSVHHFLTESPRARSRLDDTKAQNNSKNVRWARNCLNY